MLRELRARAVVLVHDAVPQFPRHVLGAVEVGAGERGPPVEADVREVGAAQYRPVQLGAAQVSTGEVAVLHNLRAVGVAAAEQASAHVGAGEVDIDERDAHEQRAAEVDDHVGILGAELVEAPACLLTMRAGIVCVGQHGQVLSVHVGPPRQGP